MSKLKLQPLSDFIFLKWDKEKETKSGIIVSDISKTKPSRAKVVAVGPGIFDKHGNYIKVLLKIGDKVLVDPFIPQAIKVEDEEFWVVRANEIFAKIN